MLILDEPTNGMDPAGREEVIELARDLAHNKGMSLLFSSHLLPDVEAVCDHVVVLGGGKLLTQGSIRELKRAHHLSFEVRVKDGVAAMARGLLAAGCATEVRDDLLLVRVPDGQSGDLVWKVAAAERRQIRYLRPQRSTLEEVFLQAVEPT
jgi:ABC-2 type transport system ATP-binding protein